VNSTETAFHSAVEMTFFPDDHGAAAVCERRIEQMIRLTGCTQENCKKVTNAISTNPSDTA